MLSCDRVCHHTNYEGKCSDSSRTTLQLFFRHGLMGKCWAPINVSFGSLTIRLAAPLYNFIRFTKDFELMKDPLHSMMRQKVGWQRNFAS